MSSESKILINVRKFRKVYKYNKKRTETIMAGPWIYLFQI